MIIHDVSQGEPEWYECRKAIPTASEFSCIITPKKLDYSAKAKPYAHKLIAEMMLGHAITGVNTTWMERGKVLESEAIKQYEFVNGVTTKRVGFLTNDDHTYGCSPDAVVLDDPEGEGLCEVKCLSEPKHVEYLLTDTVPDDYKPQVQGQLFISGCVFVDWYAFYPGMPPAQIRTYRDEEYLEKLEAGLKRFRKEMSEMIETLQKKGKWIEIPDENGELPYNNITDAG